MPLQQKLPIVYSDVHYACDNYMYRHCITKYTCSMLVSIPVLPTSLIATGSTNLMGACDNPLKCTVIETGLARK